jgi:serine/threonine protein kinase
MQVCLPPGPVAVLFTPCSLTPPPMSPQNYHIYESIARGKHSVTYKGRLKRSLLYFAVRSVDKNAPSQRARVLAEVQALRAVKCHNVLGFHAWYETTNHLWLVVDLCVGGDLLTLLRTDGRVPEGSAHGWARDAAAGLAALHAAGVIHCDLKPSNCLLDEHGRLKLTGLGLSRRIADIDAGADGGHVSSSAQALAEMSQSSSSSPPFRGTPAYMAPELFAPGGVPSYASDAWALGCVLYECLVGQPPFVAQSLTDLVTEVLNTHPPPLRVPATDACIDLLEGLLTKEPGERLAWPELEEHVFWGDGGLFADDGAASGDQALLASSVDALSDTLARRVFPRQAAFESYCARRNRGTSPTLSMSDAQHSTQGAWQQQTGATGGSSSDHSADVDIFRLSVNARRNLLATVDANGVAGAAAAPDSPHGDDQNASPEGGASMLAPELRYSAAGAAASAPTPVSRSTTVPLVPDNTRASAASLTPGGEVPALLPALRTALEVGLSYNAFSAGADLPMAQNTGGIPLSTIAAAAAASHDTAFSGGASHAAGSHVDAAPGPGPADVALHTPDAEIDFSEPAPPDGEEAGEATDEEQLPVVARSSERPSPGRVSTSAATTLLLDQLFPSAEAAPEATDGDSDDDGEPAVTAPESYQADDGGHAAPSEMYAGDADDTEAAAAPETVPAPPPDVSENRATDDPPIEVERATWQAAEDSALAVPEPDAGGHDGDDDVVSPTEAEPQASAAVDPVPMQEPAVGSPQQPSPAAANVGFSSPLPQAAAAPPIDDPPSTASMAMATPPPAQGPHRTTSVDVSAFLQRRHTRAAAAVAAAAAAVAAGGSPHTPGGASFEGSPHSGGAVRPAPTSSSAKRVSTPPLADCSAERPWLWHPSDIQVTPIVQNRRIEAWPAPVWDPNALPFRALTAWELLSLRGPELDIFLAQLCRCLAQGSGAASGNTPPPAVASTLGYLDALVVSGHDPGACSSAANVVFNSVVGTTLVRVLRTSRQVATRVRIAALLGALARHATRVDAATVCHTGLLALLMDLLAPGVNDRLRRRAMATSGELLFYAATQAADESLGGAVMWPIPQGAPFAIAKVLRNHDDEVAQHYAAKTIENVSTAGGAVAAMLAIHEIAGPLCTLAGGTTPNQHVRATAASALVRLVRAAPPGAAASLLACLCTAAPAAAPASPAPSSTAPPTGPPTPARALAAGLCDASPRVVHSWLNLLNLVLLAESDAQHPGGNSSGASLLIPSGKASQWLAGAASVTDDRGLYIALAGVLQRTAGGGSGAATGGTTTTPGSPTSSSASLPGTNQWCVPALRGKALLTWALLIRVGGPRALAATCVAGCTLQEAGGAAAPCESAVEGDTYAASCAQALVQAVSDVTPSLVDTATADAMRALAGEPGGIPARPRPLAVGATSASQGAAQELSAVACLLASPRLAHCILAQSPRPAILRHLPRLLALLTRDAQQQAYGSTSRAAMRASVHAVLEALAGGSPALELLAAPLVVEATIDTLLPALASAACDSSSGDTRFLALRAACDVVLAVLPGVFPQPAAPEPELQHLAPLLTRVLLDAVIPHAVAALRDGDSTIPLYALKLLASCLEAGPAEFTAAAAALGATEVAFSFLELENECNNVHNVRLCLQLAACPQVSTAQLAELGAAARCADVLAYAHSAHVDAFLEPALGVCRALAQRHLHWAASRGEADPGILGSWGTHLVGCLAPCLALCTPSAEPDGAPVAQLAAQCLSALLRAFPGPALEALCRDGETHTALMTMMDDLAAQVVDTDAANVAGLSAVHLAALDSVAALVDVADAATNQGNVDHLMAAILQPLKRIQATACDEGVASAAGRLIAIAAAG